jgi:hypothetical protein
VIVNVVKGLLRGLKKTVGSLIAIILSAIISYIVMGIICKPESSVIIKVIDLLKNLLKDQAIQDVFNIPELGEALSHYAAMLASPFVFFALFVVISIVLSIVIAIVIRFIPPFKKPGLLLNRLGGVGVGLVCGILVSMLVLMPFVGAINTASAAAPAIANEENQDNEIIQALEDASNDKIAGFYNSVCGWLFDSLASTEFGGEKIYLKDDICTIASIVSNVSALSGDMKDFSQKEIDAINSLIDSLDKSALLKHSLAGVLSDMAGKWIVGETFIGMEKIDAGELLNPLIDTMLTVISTSNKDNITADMRTLSDILAIMVEHDMLTNADDYESLLATLGEDGVISSLIITANKNQRMSALSDEITNLSVRALASSIGMPNGIEERYDMLMGDIASILNDSYDADSDARFDVVKTELDNSFDKYGVNVDGDALNTITDSIIADLGDNAELTGADIEEFFIVYAVASASDEAYTASGVQFDTLSETDENKIIVNTNGTISVGGRVLKNYTADNYLDSCAYRFAKAGIDIGDALSLSSADTMISSMITLEDIMKNITKYSDCDDFELEAEKVSEMIAEALAIFGGDISNMDHTELIEKMGSLLDKMSNTQVFGHAVTDDMLKGIFQSESLRSNLGLSNKEATNFADKMNETAKSETSSYETLTQSVSNTITMVNTVTDKNTTKEEKREVTEKLMTNMTPENAELLSTMTTPSMVMEYGTKEDQAEFVASSVSTLFDNMANFQSTTTSVSGDEEYAREADAVNTVIQIAMEGAESSATNMFSSADSDEDSRLDKTADEYVDLIVSSSVVSDTLIKTVYEDGNTENPFGVQPSESDKEALSSALTSYYEANAGEEDDEELMKKLNAIAIITNIDLPFDLGDIPSFPAE